MLQLPNNIEEFVELLKRGPHPCTAQFDEKYPLKDLATGRSLKRVVSALAHWSPVLGNCDFIANFVFPFLKVFENNDLMCFEAVATIMLNHGQLWFEFAPLPPINYLGIMENILANFEPVLMQFYKANLVTANVYGWSLLRSAFTEVLDDVQWLQLWDNVISQPPEFLLFCVVAYNVLLKSSIMRLESNAAIENFFEELNIINILRIITKAEELMEFCPTDLRPQNFMSSMAPLHPTQYQKLTNYPKVMMKKSLTNSNSAQNEVRLLNRKMFELEKIERSLAETADDEAKRWEHCRRLKEVDRTYEEAILREEDRVAYQKKHLMLYQKQLREREQQLLELARKSALERNVEKRESELHSLLQDFQRDVRVLYDFFMLILGYLLLSLFIILLRRDSETKLS